MENAVILSGNANQALAEKICNRLLKPLGSAVVKRFSDGEIFVEINESVRGRHVYLIQSTCPPANDTLMELLILLDALKRASAREVTVIIPYLGYSRQDRKVSPRTAVSAKLVADLISIAGATRVLSMDLHAGQIQGFFNIPSDNLYAAPILIKYFKEYLHDELENLVIVSPDAGGMERARFLAKKLEAAVAMIDKRRAGPNQIQAMTIIGDVTDKVVIILDDIIDTGRTLTEASSLLKQQGAKTVYAAATHGVLSADAHERLEASHLKKIVITDTIPLVKEGYPKIIQLSVAPLLSEAIYRIHHYDSISNLFI